MTMRKPQKLSLILIYGPAGVGKTTLADFLHDELAHTAHIGVDHIKRFISEFREILSHQEVSKGVIKAMVAEYLQQRINVIVEQGMNNAEIASFKQIADHHDAQCLIYRLDTSRAILDERVAERTTKLNKPTIPRETLDTLFEVHKGTIYPDTRAFDSGELTTQEMANRVLKDLGV
jgi:predicted kinase